MNILIVDDHTLFAQGLQLLLESREKGSQVFYRKTAETALQHIKDKGPPDLLLLEAGLPDMNGFDLVRKLRHRGVNTPTLIISTDQMPAATGMALANGASGFISKSSSSADLFLAIKTVLAGDVYMSCDSFVDNGMTEISITDRQQQILYLLSRGMLNKQIAHELSISTNTVKAHLSEIFRILKVTNRTAAVHNAYEKGIL